jgi:predicted signal transduction protein with EAL and GGDEF domain
MTTPAQPAFSSQDQQGLAAPFRIDGHEINITSSIGISVYSPDNDGPDDMMVQADLALYRAKADGRNRFCFHTPDLDQQVRERVRVNDELRAAIENASSCFTTSPVGSPHDMGPRPGALDRRPRFVAPASLSPLPNTA